MSSATQPVRERHDHEDRPYDCGDYAQPETRLIHERCERRARDTGRAPAREGVDYLGKVRSPTDSESEQEPAHRGQDDRTHV